MSLRRTAALVLRQFYLMRGSPARVISLFAWGAIDIILWGFITRYLNSLAAPGFNFVPALLGAVLLWDFLVRVMQGVTMAFLEDVWSRNFLNIFASPLLMSEYISSHVLWSIFTGAVGLTVMVLLATLVFGLSFFVYGLSFVPFVLVLFLFGATLGILGSSLVLRLGPVAEWFVWPIPAIISPFAGVFYPISTLPHWMQLISRALPPAYIFEGLRGIVHRGSVSMTSLSFGVALAVLDMALAFWVFTRGIGTRCEPVSSHVTAPKA
jgi:ABC-2 type transport system permease protein